MLRIVFWSLFSLFALVLVVVVLALLALGNLDSSPMRGWVQGFLKDNFGMEVTFEELSISPFSGMTLHDLKVATPAPYAKHAENLLTIGKLEIDWDFWPLVTGDLQIGQGELHDLKVSLVQDDQGGSSLNSLLAGFGPPAPEEEKPAEEEPKPLSGTLRGLELPVTVEKFRVRGVGFEQINLVKGQVARRTTLSSVGLDASVRPGDSGLELALALGSLGEKNETRLAIEDHTGPEPVVKEMVFRLKNEVITPKADNIDLVFSLELVRQNMIDQLPNSGTLAGLKGSLQFLPGEGLTRFRIAGLELGDGIAQSDLEIELRDGPKGSILPRITRLKGRLDVRKLLAAVPLELGLELGPTSLDYTVSDLAIEPDSGRVLGGSFEVKARSESVVMAAREDQEIRLRDLSWMLTGEAGKKKSLDFKSVMNVAGLSMKTNGTRAGVSGLSFGIEGKEIRPNLVAPVASTGELGVSIGIAGLKAGLPGAKAAVKKLALQLGISLDGQGPVRVRGELPVGFLSYKSKRQRVEVSGLGMKWTDVEVDPGLARLAARLEIPVKKIRFRAPGTSADIRGLKLGLSLPGLELNRDDPMHSVGKVDLDTSIAVVDARASGMRVSGRRLGVNVDLGLSQSSDPRVKGKIPIGKLTVSGKRKKDRLLQIEKGRLGFAVKQLVLNQRNPAKSAARVELDASLPDVSLMGDTTFSAPRLKAVLSSRAGGKKVAADLDLDLASFKAGGLRHDAALGIKLKAEADLRSPRVVAGLNISGKQGPDIDLSLAGGFSKATKKLDWNAKVNLSNLGVLGRLMPGKLRKQHRIDWKALRFTFASHGTLTGVVERFKGGTAPVIAKDAQDKVSGSQKLHVGIHGLDYQSGQLAARTRGLSLSLDASQDRGATRADLEMKAGRVSVQTGKDTIDLGGFSEKVSISSDGPPAKSRVDLTVTGGIKKLSQTMLEGYPLADARLTIKGHVDKLASVRIEHVEFENPAGGTRLKLQVAMDRWLGMHMPAAAGARIPGRKALTLTGSLSQDLDAIEVAKETIEVGGRISMPFRVESGDLTTFRVSTRIKADKVRARMSGNGFNIQGFDGDIPLIEDILLKPDGGVAILTGPPKNIYSRTRFLDTHPFLQGDNFLSLKSLSVAGQELGPIAGNLRINRDMFSLDQLQIGYKQGRVSGQLVADYQNGRPRVLFKGNLTGVRPTGGDDVLDANATVTFVPDKLDLSGRVQIIRIGRQHLLDLLDFLDPYKESVGINRARLGLKVGYPKFLRLRMQDGFLAVKIVLGGAAKLVRIDEIKNIALGPFLNKYVAPYVK